MQSHVECRSRTDFSDLSIKDPNAMRATIVFLPFKTYVMWLRRFDLHHTETF